MKKISTFIIMLAVCLTACQNRLHVNGIDNAVKEAFYNRYPKAWDVEWDLEAGNTVVMDFKDGLYDKEAWYLSDGTWLKTRTELPLFDVPKVVIDATLSALGTGWYIEEAELWETSSTPAEYYLLDCEKVVSRQETILKVLPDGTVLETPETGTPGTDNPGTGTTPGTDNPGSVTPGNGDYFAAAKLTFAAMYPNAVNVEWEMEYGKLNAEFYQDRYEKEAWFLTDGTWLFTKTELPIFDVPKVVIDATLSALGTGWYIEEAELWETSSTPAEYYLLDCEKVVSKQETVIKVLPDGTVFETPETGTPGTDNPGTGNPGTGTTPGTDNPGSVTPGNGDYFAAAKLTFAAMYPNAVNVEWEMEYGKLNAEFYQGRYEKEAWFLTDGTWLFTETELPVNEVPAALAEIILAKLGSGWYIDDAEHYTSSSEPKEYYILECENKFSDREAKLRITPDGTIL